MSVLLFTVVPAGCLPLMTAGSLVNEAKVNRNPRARQTQPSRAGDICIIAAFGVLAVLTNVRLKRLASRVRREPDETWFGLSRGAALTLLATAYALGLFGGVQTFLLFSSLES